MQKPELLAPAGDLEKLKMAVLYGADAVYLAGKSFGMRAFAGNFTEDQMREGIAFAHQHGVKVYVTVNIFAYNEDLAELPSYLRQLEALHVDALIVADPGVLALAKETFNMPCHLSTQANTITGAVPAFGKAGVDRVILLRANTDANKGDQPAHLFRAGGFVHGAMCWAYSGRRYGPAPGRAHPIVVNAHRPAAGGII